MTMSLKGLITGVVAVATIAIVDLTAIAVITIFKTNEYIDNDTADAFIAGLATLGGFVTLILIMLVGKLVITIWRE